MAQTNLRSVAQYGDFTNFRRGFLFESKYGIEDPTYLSFNVEFNFVPFFLHHEKRYSSPLFIESATSGYGAIEYLEKLGFKAESTRLKTFKNILKWVQDTTPWFFQSVDGLDEVWKQSTDVNKKFKEVELTFNCLESVDLRMTYLADLYRKSIYDTNFNRELVPENLRFFQMSVQVVEFRNIKSVLNKLNTVNTGTGLTESDKLNTLNSITKDLNYLEFVFDQCEFDFSESISNMSTVNNADPQLATSKFKIKAHKWHEKNVFPYFQDANINSFGSGAISDDEFKKQLDLKNEQLKVGESRQAMDFGILNNAVNKGKIIAGNVNTQIQNAPGQLIANTAAKLQPKLTPLGNVYDGSQSKLDLKLTSQNVYDGIVKFIPPNINTENIYEQ